MSKTVLTAKKRPRTTTSRVAPRAWSAGAAWHQAEVQDVNDAVDHLVLDLDKAVKAGQRASPETVQIRRILVCVDGSDSGDQAVGWAVGLAKAFGARVWAITVLSPPEAYERHRRRGSLRTTQQLMDLDHENGRRIVDATIRELHRAQVPAQGLLLTGDVADEIQRQVAHHDIDLLILGAHGQGAKGGQTLGRVAEKLKNATKANVLLVRSDFRAGPVLAPVDGSRLSRLSAFYAIRLARAWKKQANILYVFETPWLAMPEWGEDEFKGIIQGFSLPKRMRSVSYFLDYGKAWQIILAYQETLRPTLTVMGTRGMGKLRSFLEMGSVSNKVSNDSRTSLLLIRE